MKPEIIIMLTNNDITVKNAEEVFESCKDLPAKKWGFKDVGLPKDEMIKLAAKMKEAGKETYIEVVTYTEEGCLEGAKCTACGRAGPPCSCLSSSWAPLPWVSSAPPRQA